jgi:hypothetical protein
VPSDRWVSIRRGIVCLAIVCGFFLPGSQDGWSASAASSEYDVKAALLSHFAAFVEWPKESFSLSDGSFVLCVLGRDPFDSRLKRAFEGKRVRGHEVVIRRSSRVRELGACHVLFVSSSERARVSIILRELAGKSVLTVSDVDGFVDRGGMIQLNRSGSQVEFDISPIAIKRAQLSVSSKLLKLAANVHGGR